MSGAENLKEIAEKIVEVLKKIADNLSAVMGKMPDNMKQAVTEFTQEVNDRTKSWHHDTQSDKAPAVNSDVGNMQYKLELKPEEALGESSEQGKKKLQKKIDDNKKTLEEINLIHEEEVRLDEEMNAELENEKMKDEQEENEDVAQHKKFKVKMRKLVLEAISEIEAAKKAVDTDNNIWGNNISGNNQDNTNNSNRIKPANGNAAINKNVPNSSNEPNDPNIPNDPNSSNSPNDPNNLSLSSEAKELLMVGNQLLDAFKKVQLKLEPNKLEPNKQDRVDTKSAENENIDLERIATARQAAAVALKAVLAAEAQRSVAATVFNQDFKQTPKPEPRPGSELGPKLGSEPGSRTSKVNSPFSIPGPDYRPGLNPYNQ